MISRKELAELAAEIATRRSRDVDGTVNLPVSNFLLSLRETVVLPMMASKASLQDLWNGIAAGMETGADTTAIVLECAADLKFLSGLTAQEWSNVCHDLGRALSFNTSRYVAGMARDPSVSLVSSRSNNVIPDRILSSVAPTAEAELLIEDNHWFVFVAMLVMSGWEMKGARRVSA